MLPSKITGYLDPDYWDYRFKEEEAYDWCKTFGDFKHLIVPSLQKSDKILVLGCGNSTLTAELWKEGYSDITSIDLSEVVINKMAQQARAASMDSLKWQAADMLSLPFCENEFDVVIEKGTLDVLFVDSDSPWQPRAEVCERAHKMLQETHRVLAANGRFFSITFAQPHFRNRFLLDEEFTWSCRHETFGDTFHYFVYTLIKGSRTADDKYKPIGATPANSFEASNHEHMDREDYLLQIEL